MKYHLSRSVFTGLYYTTLLGGEFDNCHGQGRTEKEAVASLKIRVNQLRNIKSRKSMKNLIKELGNLYTNTPEQIGQLSVAQIQAIRDIITHEYRKIRLKYEVVFESGNSDLEDFEKIKARFETTGVLAISSDHNNSPLLGEDVNLFFRAWHDFIHITNDFPFGFEGEFNTFLKHIDGYEDVAGYVEVLFSEVVLQTAYFETFGDFYEDQKVVLPHYQYISRCIERFLDESGVKLNEEEYVAFDDNNYFVKKPENQEILIGSRSDLEDLGYENLVSTAKLTYSKKSELIKDITKYR